MRKGYSEREAINLAYAYKPESYGTREIFLPSRFWDKIHTNTKILELGCCMGHLANFFQKKGRVKLVVAIDLNLKVLQKSRNIYPTLSFCQTDAEAELPFKDGTFDVVISSDLIEHLFDLERHFSIICRILKEDGVYIIKTPNKWGDHLYWKMIAKDREYEISHPSVQSFFSLRRILGKYGFLPQYIRQEAFSPTQIEKLEKIASLRQPFKNLIIEFLSKIVFALPIALHPYFVVFAKRE